MRSKYNCLTTVVLLIVLAYQGKAQMPDSVQTYLDTCLIVLKNNALYANRVNWKEKEAEVREKAKTKAETFEALKVVFTSLGDMHAAFYHEDNSFRLDNTALVERYSDSLKAAWKRGPQIAPRMIDGFAYFVVPYMGAKGQKQIDWYANWLYNEVVKLHKQHPKGWIIDLRLNSGGNIRPMLAGLAPFFSEGGVSYYIGQNGEASDEASFKNGDFVIDGQVQATINDKIAQFPAAKVAVLIGPGTASSGEITAAVFSKRSNTVLIGAPTAGLANATNGFVFNDNKTYFLFSTARIADASKVCFPETIQPNIPIHGQESFQELMQDEIVKAAINWLRH
ncbi:hypothetical protein FHS57_002451 [Runella defluvii]|uniref:Tail specific protease domain-containing protein n=1 Tax=Runella defluvii TaxID=370973 RepID=A0A7W5ZJV2_9BACT|nr:S41 family peptidase [Runella defluvii]MBB3838446.1 hypothetical protein [Runella defluvii]